MNICLESNYFSWPILAFNQAQFQVIGQPIIILIYGANSCTIVFDCSKLQFLRKGRNPGLYDTWGECEEQVCGFSDQMHKSYKSRADAESAWLKYWSRNTIGGEVDDGAVDGGECGVVDANVSAGDAPPFCW